MDFHDLFKTLTGHSPFPWQRDLYRRFVEGCPALSECHIPTGLGKTSVIPIWLIALASAPGRVPRRLVYVVNRRTVVDQATDEAMSIRERLKGDEATPLRKRLRTLCASLDAEEDVPLAISTLRGQFADNREWSADPSRPAIILGTVDMIGSRLLFGGYGIGFKLKPLHAGFLGQDSLLVHDEAHLEPAFQRLLVSIVEEQERCQEFRRIHVMAMSATSQTGGTFGLTEEDRVIPEIKTRVEAKKALHIHPGVEPAKRPDRLAELALAHKDSGRAVLVFAREVESVEKVAERLRKKTSPEQVITLTGTMRGKERDELVGTSVFRRFIRGAAGVGPTVYLVCTSAGEVGVNISGDDLVCDLSTYESMAQRFGRVNRFGDRDDSRIDVVPPKELDSKDEYDSRLIKTLDLLRKLEGSANPSALDALPQEGRQSAFSPPPTILRASDIHFDNWSLTSFRGKLPVRPPAEPYLHGLSGQDPPETRVAWREEVELITEPLQERYPPVDLLEDYPIKPHEVLRDRSDRVLKRLGLLAQGKPDAPVWLLDDDGTVTPLTLKTLTDKDKAKAPRIDYRTVLLSPSVGGLRDGLFTGDPEDRAKDVADDWQDESGQQRRRRIRGNEDAPKSMRLIRVIETNPSDEAENADEASSQSLWEWWIKPKSADDDGSKTGPGKVSWDDHTNDVVENIRRLLANLSLGEDTNTALIVAAKAHDFGKRRVVWQRSIGNPDPANPLRWLAKSGNKTTFELSGFRHEFGSLLDVREMPEFRELSAAQQDLVLHVIAVHHGLGRPHFPAENAFDPGPNGKDAASIAVEVPRRFARLQRKYGRWGLAYLESFLRAADYAASANPSKTSEDPA